MKRIKKITVCLLSIALLSSSRLGNVYASESFENNDDIVILDNEENLYDTHVNSEETASEDNSECEDEYKQYESGTVYNQGEQVR